MIAICFGELENRCCDFHDHSPVSHEQIRGLIFFDSAVLGHSAFAFSDANSPFCIAFWPPGTMPTMRKSKRDESCVTNRSTLQPRSEEHTSELPSLMRISYAVFCLKNKKHHNHNRHQTEHQK